MSLVILTKSPQFSIVSKETYKKILRLLLQKQRGPSGVIASLLRGLSELKYKYQVNPNESEIKGASCIWVNESIEALSWAIAHKKEGQLLVVGPNLVVSPLEHNSLICNQKINVILQPSLWTKELMENQKPELKDKILIWPAGVQIPKQNYRQKNIDVLIFIKNQLDPSPFSRILKYLESHNLNYEIITYGRFKQKEYFNKLEHSKALLYISDSESQGLAIQEAWARNVPTLVYNRGYYHFKKLYFESEKISAPYLSDECGMFFTMPNFEANFSNFFSRLKHFSPRSYVERELSDLASAQKFINIVTRANMPEKS